MRRRSSRRSGWRRTSVHVRRSGSCCWPRCLQRCGCIGNRMRLPAAGSQLGELKAWDAWAVQVQVARHTAALVIAKVAAIELPNGQWTELVATLLANMGQQPPNSGLRQATLEALGYVCEEMGRIDQDVLEQEQINSILTAVVQGMRKDEPDSGVRLAATVALLNALEFAQTNFENVDERNYLMQVMPAAAPGWCTGVEQFLYASQLHKTWSTAPRRRSFVRAPSRRMRACARPPSSAW